MRRGDIVTIADRSGEFTGKPRPAIVLQSDAFPHTRSIVILPVTSEQEDAPLLRIPLPANAETGLQVPSWAQVELITAVRRRRIGRVIGHPDDETMVAANRAFAVFLGLA